MVLLLLLLLLQQLLLLLLIPLFTLGSIYSTKASGAEQMPETSNSN